MKFVKLITARIINWDEIAYCDFESNDFLSQIYPYFYLKNGLKFDAFEAPKVFTLEPNGKEYEFCGRCCMAYFEILLEKIEEHFSVFGFTFFDIENHEDDLWYEFTEWANTRGRLEIAIKER